MSDISAAWNSLEALSGNSLETEFLTIVKQYKSVSSEYPVRIRWQLRHP